MHRVCILLFIHTPRVICIPIILYEDELVCVLDQSIHTNPNPIVSIISVYTGMSTCLHTRVGTRYIVPSNDHIYSSFINVLYVYYTPMALILCSIYNNVCMYTTESTTNAFVPIPAMSRPLYAQQHAITKLLT